MALVIEPEGKAAERGGGGNLIWQFLIVISVAVSSGGDQWLSDAMRRGVAVLSVLCEQVGGQLNRLGILAF